MIGKRIIHRNSVAESQVQGRSDYSTVAHFLCNSSILHNYHLTVPEVTIQYSHMPLAVTQKHLFLTSTNEITVKLIYEIAECT